MKNILIVDRSAEIVDLLLYTFKKHGDHNFIGTTDGDEATKIIQTQSVDLVITGTRIYVGPSKHEFVNIACVLRPDSPVILHTNYLYQSFLQATYFPKCSPEFFRYVEEFLQKE